MSPVGHLGPVQRLTLVLVALALLAPVASGATEARREATFPMARDFDDRLTIVSGAVELDAPEVTKSAGFFRTSDTAIEGLDRACWREPIALGITCIDGPLTLAVPEGASFGFNPGAAYPVELEADHALGTFVDLSTADGFDDRLRVGPSFIGALVAGKVSVGEVPASPQGRPHGFTVLEEGFSLELRDATGLIVHRLRFDDEPLLVEGALEFAAGFGAKVVVLPFDDGAQASFVPAAEGAAIAGLDPSSIELLNEILSNVRIIGSGAKGAPLAILDKAGPFLSEIFNGAYLRTRLADNPNGFGDVAFAKFSELGIESGEGALAFEGSYTLVVGDLGPSFDDTAVSKESQPLRWWVGLFLLLAVAVVGAWLWLRDGPVQKAEPGPQTWVARIATAVGLVVAFLVWDWQLNQVLGSSLLTTNGSGAGLGLLIILELASLALAGLLIGVPVYLAVRYGLVLAKQPRFTSLAATAAVFFTVAFGILLLPALVSFIAGFAA